MVLPVSQKSLYSINDQKLIQIVSLNWFKISVIFGSYVKAHTYTLYLCRLPTINLLTEGFAAKEITNKGKFVDHKCARVTLVVFRCGTCESNSYAIAIYHVVNLQSLSGNNLSGRTWTWFNSIPSYWVNKLIRKRRKPIKGMYGKGYIYSEPTINGINGSVAHRRNCHADICMYEWVPDL